jgi:hypothetical protein
MVFLSNGHLKTMNVIVGCASRASAGQKKLRP